MTVIEAFIHDYKTSGNATYLMQAMLVCMNEGRELPEEVKAWLHRAAQRFDDALDGVQYGQLAPRVDEAFGLTNATKPTGLPDYVGDYYLALRNQRVEKTMAFFVGCFWRMTKKEAARLTAECRIAQGIPSATSHAEPMRVLAPPLAAKAIEGQFSKKALRHWYAEWFGAYTFDDIAREVDALPFSDVKKTELKGRTRVLLSGGPAASDELKCSQTDGDES